MTVFSGDEWLIRIRRPRGLSVQSSNCCVFISGPAQPLFLAVNSFSVHPFFSPALLLFPAYEHQVGQPTRCDDPDGDSKTKVFRVEMPQTGLDQILGHKKDWWLIWPLGLEVAQPALRCVTRFVTCGKVIDHATDEKSQSFNDMMSAKQCRNSKPASFLLHLYKFRPLSELPP